MPFYIQDTRSNDYISDLPTKPFHGSVHYAMEFSSSQNANIWITNHPQIVKKRVLEIKELRFDDKA